MQILDLRHYPPTEIQDEIKKLIQNEVRVQTRRWEVLLELMHYLRAQGPNPRTSGMIFGQELWLTPFSAANKVLVKIWADWQDFGPLVDGIPVMHYRIQSERRGHGFSTDAR